MFEPLSRINRALGELRRRQVYRLAGIYVIGGWLVLQVADVLLEIIDAPDGSLRMIALVLVLGFPLALVLAWVYDITPAGVVRTPRAEEAAPEPLHWNWRWLDYAIIVALLAILGFVLVRDGDVDAPEVAQSIAVLPFADLSPAGDNQYFSDGLSEALMDSLAKIPGIQVASRTSSFAYRDPGPAVREVASTLGVAMLLEGSVRKSGSQLKISSRLVDGVTGRHLWSETFDASMEDIFSVQETISRGIAETLKIRLLGAESLVPVATRDTAAYEEYLRGREQLRREGTAANIDQALAHFENALEMDPQFTLAMAGLCRGFWAKYELTLDAALAGQAISTCRRAEDQDDTPTEVLVALGGLYRHTGQREKSLELLNQALESDANNAEVHSALGETLRAVGEHEQAAQHQLRAIDLDPAYWRYHWDLGRVLVDMGKLEEAAARVRRAIRLRPDSPAPHYTLGGIYFYQEEYLKAAEAFRQSIQSHPNAVAYSNAGTQYFYAGDFVQAEEMYRQAVAMSPANFRYYAFLAESIEMQQPESRDELEGHYWTAITLGSQELEINPADKHVRAAVASYLAQVGKVEEALAELAILEDEDNLGMHTHRTMGMAYLALEREESAVRHLEAAVAAGYPSRLFQLDQRLAVLAEHPTFRALLGDGSVSH